MESKVGVLCITQGFTLRVTALSRGIYDDVGESNVGYTLGVTINMSK